MNGTTIVELDLALLDLRFLNLEFGESWPRVCREQPSERQR